MVKQKNYAGLKLNIIKFARNEIFVNALGLVIYSVTKR
jgi:hypothetical protein